MPCPCAPPTGPRSFLRVQVDSLYARTAKLSVVNQTPSTFASQPSTNASATPSGASTSFSAAGYVPKTSGTITVDASMSVLASAKGVAVTFSMSGGGPSIVAESGSAVGNANAALTYTMPCTAGTPLTVGITAAAASGTVQSPINGSSIIIVEDQD